MREETRIWKLNREGHENINLIARLVIDGTKVEQEMDKDLRSQGYLEIEITIREYPEGKP